MTPAFSHDMAEMSRSAGVDRRAPDVGVLAVEVVDGTGRVSAEDLGWLRAKAVEAAGLLGCVGQMAVRLIDDQEMSGAHDRFCGIAGTTDVLTFDLGDGTGRSERGRKIIDADVLACVDEATRQAAARGIAVREELLLYILHGVLHCLGYDDHDEAAFSRMHACEDEVLRAIGVGGVFSMARRDETGEQPGSGKE